jgi:ribulose bisphosphate carboxylase small subunit
MSNQHDVDKLAEDHAHFLAEYADELGRVFGVDHVKRDRMVDFITWFADATILHGFKHGVEMAQERQNRMKNNPRKEFYDAVGTVVKGMDEW